MNTDRLSESNPGSNPRRAPRRAGRRGFTLVELLTVVAILVVLIGLLTPSLFKAIRFARLASCAASMRAIYTGLVVYAGDNKNFVPTVGAYTRCYDGGATVGGHTSTGMKYGKPYWTGALAQTRSLDNLQLFICPGTQTWGGSDMHNSGLYARGVGGSYVLLAASGLNGAFQGEQWSNYSLRWSGWWHKVYPNARLMLAESVNSEHGDNPLLTEMDIHGGAFTANFGANDIGVLSAGSSIVSHGEPSMNICGSDGSVIRLLDYVGPSWQYYANRSEGYFACNDRSGDDTVTGQIGSSETPYTDQFHYAHGGDEAKALMSGGGGIGGLTWSFWGYFDIELFHGGGWPWLTAGDRSNWQNP